MIRQCAEARVAGTDVQAMLGPVGAGVDAIEAFLQFEEQALDSAMYRGSRNGFQHC